jgi:hypothetical protein
MSVETSTDDQLIAAVEDRLKAHDIRLKPDVTIEAVIGELKEKGVSLEVKFGSLTGKVGDLVADVPGVFETWASQNEAKVFPRSLDNITSRDQLDRAAKLKMLSQRGGLQRFESLPATAPQQPTELSASRMKASEWRALPRSVKAELCSKWTPAQVAAIQSRN